MSGDPVTTGTPSTTLIRTPITPDLVRGALELEAAEYGVVPHRLPRAAREQNVDAQLAMVEAQPSGVRVVGVTAAGVLELETVPTKREYAGVGVQPDGVYELLVDGEPVAQGTVPGGRTLVIDMATGDAEIRSGGPGRVRFEGLSAGDKQIEIWLPHLEATELVALHTDAPVRPAADPGLPVWLHHGSSISHGSNAETPTGTWPAVAARLAGVELVNLGLGGAAMLDPFTARALGGTPADLISVKIGINLVNGDVMRLRALSPAVHGFLDLIREGHPTTPLIVVSALHCAAHEDTPGPAAPTMTDGRLRFVATGDPADVPAGRLTLTVIRAELERIVAARAETDPHLSYVDGREMYAEADAAAYPLPDNLHPDSRTHVLIGERFARQVLSPQLQLLSREAKDPGERRGTMEA